MTRRRKAPPAASSKAELVSLTPIQQTLLEEADRQITILSEGRELKTTVGNVVIRKLLQTAANGSAHALGHSVKASTAAQQVRLNEIKEDVEFGLRFKEHQQRLLDEVISRGGDPESVLPHPDDILIVEGKGYRIDGPADAEQLNILKDNCRRRDVLILQAVLEDRIGDDRAEHSADPFPGATSLLLAQLLNIGLPARYCMSDLAFITMMERYRRWSKRDLLKGARSAWAGLGRSRPRGWMMPPLNETRRRIERLLPVCLNLFSDVRAGKVSSSGKIAERIGRITGQ
ncbi:hypothetical protein A33O_14996 [Nitratireductor aquibiodomus RA22]|uniref:Uncharacterized protein n=1 Tax=Nitratireductor aquibiodomus RA22 TaxID=1189611 RepID=I5BVA4_9HYPH|nr:hypothetical protein [Nitratireductor aquibiodomus]EIM73506.1 hypothetical protein A33O_14996 [Nitratireductor aquibiodomus RA22]